MIFKYIDMLSEMGMPRSLRPISSESKGVISSGGDEELEHNDCDLDGIVDAEDETDDSEQQSL